MSKAETKIHSIWATGPKHAMSHAEKAVQEWYMDKGRTKTNQFSKLPDVLCGTILFYLPTDEWVNVRKVCKYFHETHRRYWSTFRWQVGCWSNLIPACTRLAWSSSDELNDKVERLSSWYIPINLSKVRKLDLCWEHTCTTKEEEQTLMSLTHLILDLQQRNIPPIVFTNLTDLTLKQQYENPIDLSQKYFPRLEHLTIEGIRDTAIPRTLQTYTERAFNNEETKFERINNVFRQVHMYEKQKNVKSENIYCRKLRIIEITDIDLLLTTIPTLFPNLTCLEITDFWQPCVFFVTLPRSMAKLRIRKLRIDRIISNKEVLPLWFPRLQHVAVKSDSEFDYLSKLISDRWSPIVTQYAYSFLS